MCGNLETDSALDMIQALNAELEEFRRACEAFQLRPLPGEDVGASLVEYHESELFSHFVCPLRLKRQHCAWVHLQKPLVLPSLNCSQLRHKYGVLLPLCNMDFKIICI